MIPLQKIVNMFCPIFKLSGFDFGGGAGTTFEYVLGARYLSHSPEPPPHPRRDTVPSRAMRLEPRLTRSGRHGGPGSGRLGCLTDALGRSFCGALVSLSDPRRRCV
jgi:hypothetical protein